MWTMRSERLDEGGVLRFVAGLGPRLATYAEVVRGWQVDVTFRTVFNDALTTAPYSAFRWETPPVTAATADRPFEFVLLNDPGLARHPDRRAFAEHFRGDPEAGAVRFSNLSGDAVLVVPRPIADVFCYGHLAAFVREAPESQRNALWQAVGVAMSERLSARPVWLSTAGAGVSWLHVRLDDRPKYFGYGPYRNPNFVG